MKWLLVALIAASTSAADVLQSAGMKRHGEIRDFRPHALITAIGDLLGNLYILSAIAALSVSFFGLLALMSISDLTFAVPATAASYIFDTLLARFLLKEQVRWQRWAGVSLVASGVVLLSL